jgi:glyoxylase-like metal-dependent hydrolase (beta-lactamase superfamily II)
MLMTSKLAQSPATRGSRSDWFAIRPLGHDIYVVAEPGHVNSFLVLGRDRALLFDTGMGMRSILSAVRSVTALPLVAVNSHHHYDHRGGNAELAAQGIEIATHERGAPLHDRAPDEWLRDYAAVARRMSEDFARFAELDSATFFMLTDAQRVRPLPDLSNWRIPAVAPTSALGDGQLIDLGGRTLRVVHTPGHSPDGLCLWDEASGSLLAGDTVLAAAFWAHFPESDIGVFCQTLSRLTTLPVRRVLVAHNLRYELPGSYIAAVLAAFTSVRDGGTTPVSWADPFGNPVCRHNFDGFAIFSPVAMDGAP